MRLCLKLGGILQDFLTVPLDKQDSADYIWHLTKVLLERNATLIRLSQDNPEFYVEMPRKTTQTFLMNINQHNKPSLN